MLALHKKFGNPLDYIQQIKNAQKSNSYIMNKVKITKYSKIEK